jgi:hypothetical protein
MTDTASNQNYKLTISYADCKSVADRLGVDPLAVLAVARVESGSDINAFLFEPHVFSRLTNHVYDQMYPEISYPEWNRAKYPKNSIARQQQFEAAVKISPEKAYQSASWGLFQIMGFHYKGLEYVSAIGMATDLKSGVEPNIRAFAKVIEGMGLVDELRDQDWAKFARVYNGPGYKLNNYDVKISAMFHTLKTYGPYNS